MIGSIDIRMDFGIDQFIVQRSRCNEVVDTPASILFPRLETIRPPGIDFFLVGVEITECIRKARREQMSELGTLLIGEARIAAIGLWILQVDFLMRHIQVATEDNRLLRLQLLDVSQESILPRHAIIQSLQSILRVGYIDRNEIKMLHLQRDDTSFVIVFLHPYSIRY